jgi:arabinofuranosyltransferase
MQSRKAKRGLVVLLLLSFTYIFIITAWVCDDAYITFRTIDNFVSGYGLRWNIDERVQAYTHPLWMFIIALLYSVTAEPYFTSIALSFLFSLAAILILLYHTRDTLLKIVIVALLISSKAFTDYTSSGLENPLAYFLVILFVIQYLRNKSDFKNILYLCFLSSLILLTRLDLFLIIALPLFHAIYSYSKSNQCNRSVYAITGALLIGFSPLIAWELFSLLYYGFFLPNTAYAKLCTGIPAGELFIQGLDYIKISSFYDPITPAVIIIAIIMSFTISGSQEMFLGVGILLYVGWVILIGGDFMAGRMLAVPFFLAVSLLSKLNMKNATAFIIIILIAFYNARIDKPPAQNTSTYTCKIHWNDPESRGIADERGVYYKTCGLLNVFKTGEPNIPLIDQGKAIRKYKKQYYICTCLGYTGYYAGHQTYLIDKMALADPLLSRINHPPDKSWRIGHFSRELPKGYIESIKNDTNAISDADLNKLYAAIRIITRSPLFSRGRIEEILKFNLGHYNGYLHRENYETDSNDHLFDLILYDTTFVYDGTSSQSAQYLPGDIDADGRITRMDLAYLRLFFKGMCPRFPAVISQGSVDFYPAADVNGDCRITLADYTRLQNYLWGLARTLISCPNIPSTEL